MKKDILTAYVNSEMNEYFPKGKRLSRNNELRISYNILRRHDLATKPSQGSEIIREECIAIMEQGISPAAWLKRKISKNL